MDSLLNKYQRISVTNVLRLFEESLRQAESWLDGAEKMGILYQRKLLLSEAKRQEARQKISLALAEISDLAETFRLARRHEDASRIVYADMTHLWTNLSDSTSEKLSRYGEVDERLADQLDPTMVRLSELALEIAAAFNEHPQQGRKSDPAARKKPKPGE